MAGMLVDSPHHEVRKREVALKIINSIIKKQGRSLLYDLTGLAGGFPLEKGDIDLLETYAGPAFFEDLLDAVAKEHLGGEKILAFNRTTSGVLATILALVKSGDEVVHYLPKLPSHPSVPRSVELVGAEYREFDDIKGFSVDDNTSLVIVTGSTMDHDIIEEIDFFKIIEISKSNDIPVFVDDASGARLRTILYHQPRAMDMGVDMVITSTDKLMDGPRGGIMAGKSELMELIKSKAHQFGLEAQPPLVAGMVRALENFNPQRILKTITLKDKLYKSLNQNLENVQKTPTGIIITADGLREELKQKGFETSLSAVDVSSVFSMLLLRNYHIITIPAVGMPGASPSIRIDLTSRDAERVSTDYIVEAFLETFKDLGKMVHDKNACESVLYG
jgi:L-seryl-tRNA(Ser) seleniumtransferase